MPFLMEEFYKGRDLPRQDQLKQIAADELKRVAAEEKAARQEKIDFYKNQPTEKPSVVPSGFMPGEPVTPMELAAKTTPTSPFGTTVPTDSDKLGGMQPITPQQSVPVQEQPTNIVQATNKASQEFMGVQTQIDTSMDLVKRLRDKGLVDAADKEEARVNKLKETQLALKEKYLSHATKVIDLTSNLANGYLKAVDEGADSNTAWNRMLMSASASGIDTKQLLGVPPEQRSAVANQFLAQAETAKIRSQTEIESMKELGRQARLAETNALREKLSNDRLRAQARREEGIQARWEAGRTDKENKANETILSKVITQAQADRRAYDEQIKETSFRINGLRSGNILTDMYGNKLDKAGRIKEVTALQEKLDSLSSARDTITSEIEQHEEAFKDLQKHIGGKATKPTTEEETTAKVVQPTKEDINLAIQAINDNPDKLDVVKANWERLHPGVPFDKYVKVNKNSKAFKKP